MPRFLYLFVVVALTITPKAYALDAEGLALKQAMESLMERQREMAADQGAELVYDGEITIEDAESYYAVTLPHAKLNFAEGGFADIGMVAINASPHPEEGLWKMSMALPTPFFIYGEEDAEPILKIDFPTQRAAGIWDSDIHYFTKLNLELENVNFQHRPGQFDLDIGTVLITSNLQKDAQALYSGPTNISFRDVVFAVPASDLSIVIGEAGLSLVMDAYDIKALGRYQEQLEALEETPDNEDVSSDHVMGLTNLIFDMLTKSGDGIDLSYGLKNFSMYSGARPGKPEIDVSLGDAEISFKTDGFRGDAAQLQQVFQFRNLLFQSEDPALQQLVPKDMTIDIRVEKLPLRKIFELSQGSLRNAVQNPDMASISLMGLLFQIPALLTVSGTEMSLPGNVLKNDTYRLLLDGRAVADVGATNMAVADLTLRVYGYDDLIAAMQNAAKTEQGLYNQNTQQLMAGIMFAKSFAQAKTDEAGRPYDSFHFQMTADGRMLLNGRDVKTLNTAPPPAASETP